jgi:hypothetical protein
MPEFQKVGILRSMIPDIILRNPDILAELYNARVPKSQDPEIYDPGHYFEKSGHFGWDQKSDPFVDILLILFLKM